MSLRFGRYYKNRGIYLGECRLSDMEEWTFSDYFFLFAAKEDLKKRSNYYKMTKEVSEITNLHGHNGIKIKSEKELAQILKNNRYDGEWFLPTRDIVKDILYKNKDRGQLKDTFNTESAFLGEYWTCTETGSKSWVYVMNFSGSIGGCTQKKNNGRLVRPVRLERKA